MEERLRPIAPKIVKILQEHAVQQNVEKRDTIRMTLKEHIDDIGDMLKQGAFANERERIISRRIVNRLLQALEWPIFTPRIVVDEYVVEGRRVDFALCHPASTPRVFIEAKRVGNIDKRIRQLFEYAFHIGIPIVVLTDGQKWRFYHPAGEGSYENRMVAEIDLIAENSEECSDCLNRYLNFESVKTGKAAQVIAADYQRIVGQRKIEEILPETWTELVQEKNEYLLLAMMEKANDKVGREPTEEQVVSFLKNLSVPSVKPKPYKRNLKRKRLRVTFDGEEPIEHKNSIDTFIAVTEKLGIEDVKDLNIIRNKIPLISTTKDLQRAQHQRGQYYIVSGLSIKNQESTLKKIAEDLGVDLKIELVDKVLE